ncbi:hypothetical protein [Nocardioides flavescens]|nr:hypothetical protein [Nocardioides flavescens]
MTLPVRLCIVLAVCLLIPGRADLLVLSAVVLLGIAVHQRAWSVR